MHNIYSNYGTFTSLHYLTGINIGLYIVLLVFKSLPVINFNPHFYNKIWTLKFLNTLIKKIFPFMFVVSKHGSVMQEWLNYI